MQNSAKIYIAGHNGLVGSALVRRLKTSGFNNLLCRSFEELDLTDQRATADFFITEKPEYVFLAAAKVGGIKANNTYPADFIYQNLQIQNNVIHQSYLNGVKKLLFLGSSCIYPRECLQPIKEEYLLSSPLEKTNEPYAIAKIAGLKMCQSYNRQYGTNYIASMPTNLYGPNDNFDPVNSHVIPALIRKMIDAKETAQPTVELWGDGTPYREFLHVDDMADGCLALMESFNPTKEQNEAGEIFVNLGSGTDVTIAELADIVRESVGYGGEITWSGGEYNGTPRKLLDVSRAVKLGWSAKITLSDGIRQVVEWYLKNRS
jgi:GDP-L-fucose synthase